MAKDPAILFYTQDFLIGSSLLTALQKGHYITLLCYQQQSETGSLKLEEIQSLMKADYKKHWPSISKKFRQDENGFYNQRMRNEIERRKQNSTRQKENALKRWDKSGNATALPLEIETEIRNSKGGPGEKHEIGSEAVAAIANSAWTDQHWRHQLCAGLYIKTEEHLKRWMAQFNASVSNDSIAGFDVRTYKKMLRGWIVAQQAKGTSVEEQSKEANQSANYRFKKIS